MRYPQSISLEEMYSATAERFRFLVNISFRESYMIHGSNALKVHDV